LQLTNTKLCAIIDAEDLAKVLAHTRRWSVTERSIKRDGQWFIEYSMVKGASKILGKTINLGWAVLGYQHGMCIDHINGNPLDNRKCNLRLALRSQNNANCKPRLGKTTKGFYKDQGNYRVSIKYTENGQTKRYSKRGFKTEEEAILHSNEMYRKFHGEFAKLNNV
jgi:hypothetical protein